MTVVDFEDQRHHWHNRPRPPGCQCDDDPCTCGCQDRQPEPCCGGGGIGDLVECYNQIEALRRVVRDILDEMGGPIKTGPVRGIIDGSTARPGDVGELVANVVSGSFPASSMQQVVSALVLQPGDWQVEASCLLSAAGAGIFGGDFFLTPLPTGVNNNMRGVNYSTTLNTQVQMNAPTAQVNVTVPTLLAFRLETNTTQAVGASGGTFQFSCSARRMR
jgi:hypothetical protein